MGLISLFLLGAGTPAHAASPEPETAAYSSHTRSFTAGEEKAIDRIAAEITPRFLEWQQQTGEASTAWADYYDRFEEYLEEGTPSKKDEIMKEIDPETRYELYSEALYRVGKIQKDPPKENRPSQSHRLK